jgi:CHRD domain
MRKTILVLGLLATAGYGSMAVAAMTTYKTVLNGATEVPPVQSTGTGAAAVNADPATKEVSWRVEYSGLSGPAMAAHIHCGAPAGQNSGVAVSLGSAADLKSPITGTGQMTDAQLADLAAGKCYINIHTAAHKGGEIRGQLAP